MKTLLIVEDENFVKQVYIQRFEFKFNILIASNFSEFESLLEKNHVDIVLTDFNFPGGDGNQVAEISRAAGVKLIILQSAAPELCNESLFNHIFCKLSKELFQFVWSVL